MGHLFVLSFFEIVLSKNEVHASSTTFSVWDRINITFQIDPPLWVVEVCQFTIVINVDTDFVESGTTTELTEEPLDIEINPLTALAKEFESLNSCENPAIEVEQLEAHLDDHILHRVIRSNEFNEINFSSVVHLRILETERLRLTLFFRFLFNLIRILSFCILRYLGLRSWIWHHNGIFGFVNFKLVLEELIVVVHEKVSASTTNI